MTSTADIRWLAGLLEGEGCFYGSGPGGHYSYIGLQMTDRDVVEHAADIMGVRRSKIRTDKRPNGWKTRYGFSVGSAKAVAWMMTLYLLMGWRRRERIRERITVWKTLPGRWPGKFHQNRKDRT